jgi:hypothetical protein
MLELSLTPAEQFQAISDRIRALLSGKSTGPNEDVWEIHESSEDRITLRNTALPDSFTILKRVAPSNSIR